MRTDINSLSNANDNLKNYMMSTAARRGDVKELMDVIKIWEDEILDVVSEKITVNLPDTLKIMIKKK